MFKKIMRRFRPDYRLEDHPGFMKGFMIVHKAWYAECQPGEDKEILIGIYNGDGAAKGEFGIRWHELDGRDVPRLEIFNDAWDVFFNMTDLQQAFAGRGKTGNTPESIVRQLLKLGYKDLTSYKREG